MKEVTFKLYTIGELSDQAKEKARDWYRGCWDSNDSDHITESIKDHIAYTHGLQSIGYEPGTLQGEEGQSLKIWWRLSSCQGDGVAFEGRPDLDALAKKQPDVRKILARLARLGASVHVAIKHHGNYYHWNSMEVEVIAEDEGQREKETDARYRAREDKIETLGEELKTTLAELLKTISRDAEKIGYAEIEYQQSAEAVDETLEANAYTFLESGERFEVGR